MPGDVEVWTADPLVDGVRRMSERKKPETHRVGEVVV
jgi:hypothetical protein